MSINKITKDNYATLKELFGFFLNNIKYPLRKYFPKPEHHPIFVLEKFEKQSMAVARKSLQLGLNDLLEDINDWPQDVIPLIDEELKKHGLITLTELRIGFSNKYQKILERGVVRTEVEYYLIKGIRDGSDVASTDIDFAKIDEMLHQYELKAVPKHKSGKGK